MRLTGKKEIIGTKSGFNNRGYWLSWKCPNCKYDGNDSIVVATMVRDEYHAKCEKCDEKITIINK